MACVVSALTAVLFVSLIGFLCIILWQILAMLLDMDVYELNQRMGIEDTAGFFSGVGAAVFLSSFNWYLSIVVIPFAWFVISQTTGRLPHRGIARFKAYFWTTGLTGAALVGATCFVGLLVVHLVDDLPNTSEIGAVIIALGGLTMGSVIGLAAGLLVGLVHYFVLRPREQLENTDLTTAEVFS